MLAMGLSPSLGFELARRLSGETSIRGALQVVLEAMLELPGIDGGGAYIFDAPTGVLELVVHRGLSAPFVERARRYSGDDPHVTVPRSGTPLFAFSDALASGHAEVRGEGITSLGIVPVHHAGELVAVLNAASRTCERFDDATQAALISLAALVGNAIARAAAEDALRLSEARLQLSLQATGQEAWEWDLEHADIKLGPVWTSALAPAAAKTGVHELDLAAMLARLIHPDDHGEVSARLARSGQLGDQLDSEHRVLRADGETRWVRVIGTVTARAPDGRPRTIHGTTTDVTERRALHAKALQGDRLVALGRVAAGIAHEINNPLAYIVANIDFALERVAEGGPLANAELRLALEEARSGATTVRAIAGDLRALARSDERGESTADVAEALRNSVSLARHEIRQRARLETSIAAMPRVSGSASRLAQVFLNLLINAAQAIPEGAAEANAVRASAHVDAAGRACVEIRDSGSGISADVLPRIFDPFFTTKQGQAGTGLGLSISHAIVTTLGGEIEVETELGKGTCFRVVLPPMDAPRVEAAPTIARGPTSTSPKRVLVIDDEPFVAKSVLRLLRGHAVEIAIGAEEALARLGADDAYDVLLCDLVMPGLDGPALFERVRTGWPHLLGRMVFMTGGAFTDRAREFLERESPIVLAKPFDATELRELVAHAGEARQS
jgi:signal transduction histidine kinase